MLNLKDSNGARRTQSLFFETNNTDTPAIFTLKEQDHEHNGITYVSMKQIYLSFDDPTEWEFAQSVFGSWEHWLRLLNNKILRTHIEQWRAELEVKVRSAAVKQIIKQSKNKDSAAKWLAEGSWKGKRGRPSKTEVERERKIQAGIAQDIDTHWDRLMPDASADSKLN